MDVPDSDMSNIYSRFSNIRLRNLPQLALTLALCVHAAVPAAVLATGPTPVKAAAATAKAPGTMTLAQAYALYTQKQYDASADAFELLLKKAAPEPRLYYYAGLANRAAFRPARAKQLFEYITTYFASSPEATFAGTGLAELGGKAKEKDAVADKAAGEKESEKKVARKRDDEEAVDKPRGPVNSLMFTPAEVAAQGANGIDQSGFPNCWFEAAMSALAQLPRGQRLIASMVRWGEGDTYLVRFPGDGKQYVCTDSDLKAARLANKAKWASLLEYAQTKKFPNNAGAEGSGGDQSRLEVGMECITGRPAEIIEPRNSSVSELSSFIGGAVRSQNPITCGTFSDVSLSSLPPLVIGSHAYTIIGFETGKNMVVIRNPHGRGSRKFKYDADPQHQNFEYLGDGVFKMSLPFFQNYFHSVARSFI